MVSVQDDARENQLIALFRLERPPNPTRSGLDAILRLPGIDVPFELKSTSKGSVTTVRDFGDDHIQKWKNKHWLIGFYRGGELQRCLYGSPLAMQPWILNMERYIAPDITLAAHAPLLVTEQMLFAIVGNKPIYKIEDAAKIQKKQLTSAEYTARMDHVGGFSREVMLELLRERCAYLITRGATLNNPHINAEYFSGKKGPGTDQGPGSWITLDHTRPQEHLREEVRHSLAPPTLANEVKVKLKTEELTVVLDDVSETS